jgi:predicted PurR-regulated permease PerM
MPRLVRASTPRKKARIAPAEPVHNAPRVACHSGRRPTPIAISRTARNLLIAAGILLLLLILWAVPILPVVLLGGFAVALVLSFPVHFLSQRMPRTLAILLAFLILLATLLLFAYGLAPIFIEQSRDLIAALPKLMRDLEALLIRALEALDRSGVLPSTAQDVANRFGQDLEASFGVITENIVGGTVGFVFGTFSFVLTLFAVIFIAASLLANARDFKAAYLTSVPTRYRHDALELWDDLSLALSQYLSGLGLILIIQGAVSALALALIGVPYSIALGAWVSVTAVIPYLGAWLGAIPALFVAFSISPTAVVLTAIVFLAIQQLEGNVLTPRIQGQTIRVPSVVVFLAVIAGGALFGIIGVLFAVPALAVLRVLFDFLRVRLRTK